MTRVHIIAEDKTGGGLEAVLRAEANHQRQSRGLPPLDFSHKPSSINGNAELHVESLPAFIATVRTGMGRIAQGDKSNAEWAKSSAGFHAHVLVWERETLLLPVLTQLGLGEPIADVCARRDAADIVKERFKRSATRAYAKAIDGPRYLFRIAQDEGLRRVVFEANPYLRDIVEELAAL